MDILVVEDDPAGGNLMVRIVERFGHRAELCGEAKAALQQIRARSFDLVFLDLFLPDAKGHAIIPLMKEMRPGIPIAAMTGCNSRELELEVRQRGITAYLIKPVETAVIGGILEHLSSHRTRHAFGAPHPNGPDANSKVDSQPFFEWRTKP